MRVSEKRREKEKDKHPQPSKPLKIMGKVHLACAGRLGNQPVIFHMDPVWPEQGVTQSWPVFLKAYKQGSSKIRFKFPVACAVTCSENWVENN